MGSLTYERVTDLPQRIADIRARIRSFVEAVFPEQQAENCPFPF